VHTEPALPEHVQYPALRTVVLASADADLRARIRRCLTGLRWQVREAGGGAEAIARLEETGAEALLMDSWLPDLDAAEFAHQVHSLYPSMDLLRLDGGAHLENGGTRSPRRNELLHALREAHEDSSLNDTVAWATAPATVPKVSSGRITAERARPSGAYIPKPEVAIAELVGRSQVMLDLAHLIRLVAPRSTSVLIEGETGTGKEIVARSLHRLSTRASKTFAVLNCAAIPEALLEAELFGHTRGAFTGAVQARTGRIEAAHGGTLFLDEIGEMPLALQAKMLRFLECGELQRVGDNETMHVDVRVIAATHQPLETRARERSFRLDLYHRLAVFPIEVPALRHRKDDIALLAEHFLDQMGQEAPRKRLSVHSAAHLLNYDWPGNVRELMHVLERASILAEDRPQIQPTDICCGRVARVV
jgi:transcriptional regulator with GAF, ATPase, and Fis domain